MLHAAFYYCYRLQRNVTRPTSVPDTAATVESDGTIPMKTVMEKVTDWVVVNDKKPLWLRPAKTCAEEEYADFYKHTFKAYDTPLGHSHFSVEGNVDFKALLYLPSEVPYELSRDMFAASARSMRLYVRRVFINDKFEDLLPRWLLFLRGVVDSDDLPLNVGREILQQSRSLRIIRQRLVKKAIEMMTDLAVRNETEYLGFWNNFGKYVKVGIVEDEKSRDELVPLCRFFSSHTEQQPHGNASTSSSSSSSSAMTSLSQYVDRMREGQRSIYYAVGDSRAQAARSPALEKLRQKGFEVLYVSEPLDEMTLQSIETYRGKPLVDAGKEAAQQQDATEEERREKQAQADDSSDFRAWMKGLLGDRITRVEVSVRLVDSPAALLQSEYGVSPSMQKYLRAQAVVSEDAQGRFANVFNQAVLEINLAHPVIVRLRSLFETDPKNDRGKETVDLLFNTAALAAGYVLDNSAEYAQSVVKLMSRLADQ
jgi:HSP90 family molecular chaperone